MSSGFWWIVIGSNIMTATVYYGKGRRREQRDISNQVEGLFSRFRRNNERE